MKIINSPKEYDSAYWYESKPEIYPSYYPCILKIREADAGVSSGYYKIHDFYYPPEGVDIKTFEKCLLAVDFESCESMFA